MAKNNNADVIAIYSRKSKFTGKGESIGNQVELCKEYIRSHEGDSAAENAVVYEDEGFSGGNLNRPDFKKMMEAARAHQFRAIIVYRLDRISRNISDFSSLIEELDRLGINFISIREQFDTTSPMGRAMMYIASVFSQLERETIAERIRDNMHELAKTGRWLGGITPTGYASEAVKSITIDGKAKRSCKLKLIPQEADLVRLIFQLYTDTDSLTMTEAALMKQGYKTKNGRHFTRFSIKGILQNPVYVLADKDVYNYFILKGTEIFSDESEFDGVHGIMAYNRTDQEKGKAVIFRPMNEWIVSVGLHPGIVPGKTWVKIQESLERNKTKAYRKPRSNEALLTGLLYCSCGNRMYPKLTPRKTLDGKLIYTYVCYLKEHSKRSLCNIKNANGNTLDLAVIEQLKCLQEDRSIFNDELRKSQKYYTGNQNDYEQRLTVLKKEKADNENKMSALIDSLTEISGSAARVQVSKRIEQLDATIQEITVRIREFEGLLSQSAFTDSEFDIMRQLLAVFKDSFDEMSLQQKRAAVRALVRKVIWDGTNAHIILFGSDPDDAIEFPTVPGLDQGPESTNSDAGITAQDDFEGTDFEDISSDESGESDESSKTHWCTDSE